VSVVADLLTHVLAGYVLGMLVAFRYDSVGRADVTIVMFGALAPDFVKIELFFPDWRMQHLLGIPFSWSPLHTLGGTILLGLLTALVLAPEYRRRAFALFLLGAASHHVLDVVLITSTGQAYAVFWPLTDYRPPAGGLFLSSDRWPALVSGACAAFVWAVAWVRRRSRSTA
jgi:membrane-bound metal-dependent hydrolase YbcI (DUF457 family)